MPVVMKKYKRMKGHATKAQCKAVQKYFEKNKTKIKKRQYRRVICGYCFNTFSYGYIGRHGKICPKNDGSPFCFGEIEQMN